MKPAKNKLTKPKKRNPADHGKRNTDARKKEIAAIHKRLEHLERITSENGWDWAAVGLMLSDLQGYIQDFLNCEQYKAGKPKKQKGIK